MIVVRTLGTAQIEIGETRILPTSPRKFALLLYLAAERGRPVARATLQDLIFPDQTEKNGRHSLRELVYQLRQAGVPLQSDASGVQLEAGGGGLDLDLLVATNCLTDHDLRQIESGFLTGYAPEQSEAFSDWLAAYKARTTFEICRFVVTEVNRSRNVGDWDRAERAARACLALDPLNEAATMVMAEALTVGGAKTQAVRLLNTYIAEVGDGARELRIAPAMLRRRIGEQSNSYDPSRPALSPFVGREREMRLLRDQLQQAVNGNSQCIAIIGEAGIGKSRLVAEFSQLVGFDGVCIAATAAQPHDVHRPLGAFADLFQKLIELPGALGISPDSMSLLRRLVTSPSSDVASFANAARESDGFSLAMARAIVDLVDAITAETPLLLVLEDIPSLDKMSLQLLARLLSGSRSRRLCVFVTTRHAGPLSDVPSANLTTVELRGVDPVAVSRLIDSIAQRESLSLDAEMSRWLQDTSGGHPFFLESLLAHYSSTGERFAISPSLSSLLRQRMDSLSDRALAALQTCSVLGKYSTLETIVEATQLSRFELIHAIHELEASRLLRAERQEVRPTHSLISDVVVQRMTPLELRLTHQCVALALEARLRVDHSAAIVWECGEHWYAAGNTERALAAIRRCASHAVEIGRPEAAAQILSRALTLSLTPVDRVDIARRLVAAADAAMDSDGVLEAIAIVAGMQSPATHDELEFAEFRARARIYCDNGGQERELMRCVSDVEASPNHRVTAATLLLKYAHSVLDRALAVRTMAALPVSSVESAAETVRLEYLVLAYSAMNSFEKAAECARNLAAAVIDAPYITRLHLSLNAALALHHSGFLDEAAQLAETQFREKSEADAPHLRQMLAIFLSEHYFDTFDELRAEEWWAEGEAIVVAYPALANQLTRRILALTMALAKNDARTGREVFDEMERSGLFDGGAIRARWRRVARIRIDQIEGNDRDITDQDLQDLINDARQGSIVGGVCDTEAAAVCFALARKNGIAEARAFLLAYVLESRQSRAPLSRCITEAWNAVAPNERIEEIALAHDSGTANDFGSSHTTGSGRGVWHNAQRSNAPLVARWGKQAVPKRT